MKNENKEQMSTNTIIGIVAIIVIALGALFLLGNEGSNELNTANVLQTEQASGNTELDFDDDSPSAIPELKLNFPPAANECLIELYGYDYSQRLMSGNIDPNEAQNAIEECMEISTELERRQSSSVFEAVKHFLHR